LRYLSSKTTRPGTKPADSRTQFDFVEFAVMIVFVFMVATPFLLS
jgi:hypothetical protein